MNVSLMEGEGTEGAQARRSVGRFFHKVLDMHFGEAEDAPPSGRTEPLRPAPAQVWVADRFPSSCVRRGSSLVCTASPVMSEGKARRKLPCFGA